MRDVALRAGVSGQTVSRVVNDSPRVDPATRARVEAAMAQLGYRPHRAARALRTGRTHTIGLVVSTLASVGNSRMLQAVADAASHRGYALTVVTAADADALAGAFEHLRDQGVDGAIVLNEATAAARRTDAPSDLALVVVDSPADERFGVVQSDHEAGARAATEHLIALGHPTVWHLAGPADSYAATERERGWRAALEGAGLVAPPVVGETGRRHPVIPKGSRLPSAPMSLRSSWRTTRWRSACCGRSPRPAARCLARCRWRVR